MWTKLRALVRIKCNIYYIVLVFVFNPLIMREYIEVIKKSNLFFNLSDEDILKLFENKSYRVKKYDEQQYLFTKDQPCEQLCIVLKGSVRAEMADMSGTKLKVEDLEAPNSLAIAFLFGQNNRYPVDIISNTKLTLLIIPRNELVKMMQEHSVFLDNFISTVSNRTQFLSKKLFLMSFKTIRKKIVFYLTELMHKQGETITLASSRESIAQLFGVTRPALDKCLSELRDEGLIEYKNRNLRIINKIDLVKILND